MRARPAIRKAKSLPPSDEEEDSSCYNCNPRVNPEMMQASVNNNKNSSNKFGRQVEGREPCSWFEIQYLVKEIANKLSGKRYDCILGISNGGVIPAKLLAEELGMDMIQLIPVRKKEVVQSEMPKLDKKKKYLVIDDIYDTGSTYAKVAKALKGFRCDYAFCMTRYDEIGVYGRILNHSRWIVFPWEANSKPS